MADPQSIKNPMIFPRGGENYEQRGQEEGRLPLQDALSYRGAAKSRGYASSAQNSGTAAFFPKRLLLRKGG